jgi:hypothetical protein
VTRRVDRPKDSLPVDRNKRDRHKSAPTKTDPLLRMALAKMDHSTLRAGKAQIDATRDVSQWIVGQSPLSALTIPGCC